MNLLKKFKHTFHITIWEAIIAISAIIVYFILSKVVFSGHPPLFITILGLIVGTWLAFRPSEWAVSGLDSGARYVGLSDYVAGILSSLASNLPEAVIAIILITEGQQLTAVITVLSAAGFNTLILGIAILIATIKNRGNIDVPHDLEKRESPIIRWAIVAMLMTVVFGIVQYAYYGENELDQAVLTLPVSVLLFASYIIYLGYLIAVKDNTNKIAKHLEENNETKKDEKEIEQSEEHHHDKLPIPITILLLALGFGGIFLAGETLTEEVGHLIAGISFGSTTQSIIITALILGAAGAIPEHSIAIVSSAKGDVEVGIGNAMGGILQSALLIFGLLGILIPPMIGEGLVLHPFILIQLASIGATLWFVKRCIHDGKFDTFEGVMILILQILVFTILFEEIALFP